MAKKGYKKGKKRRKSKSKKQDTWIQKAVPKSHEGRFLAWSKRHGFPGVNNASVRAGMNSSNSHVRHMAQFARNMRNL